MRRNLYHLVLWSIFLLLAATACQGPGSQENQGEITAGQEPYPEMAAQETTAAKRPPNTRVNTSHSEGVILTQERAAAAGENLFGAEVQGYWVPAEADIQAMEQNLLPFVQENQAAFGSAELNEDRLSQYKRQYLGIIQDGQRVIFTNFLCQAPGDDWQREYIFMLDGGACFFRVKYRLDTGTFHDLQVNGDA